MPSTYGKRLGKHASKYGALYIMLLLPMTMLILFRYVPMYGIQIAFREFRITRSIANSPWVGLKYFEKFLTYYDLGSILRNTLLINLYSLLTFPLAPIFALMLTHLPLRRYVKAVQNISYVPHFISTVVMCGMLIQFTNARTGMINSLTGLFGVAPVNYLARSEYFYSIYVWSGVWQGVGYSSIIYIAALAGVSPELHEAAIIDGASITQRMRHIDIPSILPTITILLIMQCGTLLSVGFEKILLLQNALNISRSSVISTYSYSVGLGATTPQYSYSAAIGMFTSVINFVLLCAVNSIAKRLNQTTLW